MTYTTLAPTPMGAFYKTFCAALVLICLATLSAAQGYGVRPGDSLRIEVLEDPSLNRTVLVAPDGRISFPSAGNLRVSGRTVEAIQRNLATRLEAGFASTPNVFVGVQSIAEPRITAPVAPAAPETISVFVMGEANNPGERTVAPGTSVLQMFAVMGGFTKFAATKRIQLRRTDPATGVENITTLNYRDIERGAATNSIAVQDGDVFLVPQRRLFE
jgi:polysaccharide export outer membrane protein